MTSQIAMHLSAEHRSKLFSALDALLGVEHWEDESTQVSLQAFQSFLRFLIFGRPIKFPNLGVSPRGGILAGWRTESKSAHAEFLPQDVCVVLLKTETARGPEGLAWRGPVARLRIMLAHNEALDCIE
jgi:hypothetical protein